MDVILILLEKTSRLLQVVNFCFFFFFSALFLIVLINIFFPATSRNLIAVGWQSQHQHQRQCAVIRRQKEQKEQKEVYGRDRQDAPGPVTTLQNGQVGHHEQRLFTSTVGDEQEQREQQPQQQQPAVTTKSTETERNIDVSHKDSGRKSIRK